MNTRGALGILFLVLVAAGCGGVWDLSRLEARYPALRSVSHPALGDATPYLWPARGALVLFLCRWETDRPIAVSIALGASALERRAIERALEAWEAAGLGIRFVRAGAGAAAGGIHLRVSDAERGVLATTGAECAVELAAEPDDDPERLNARLVSAEIVLGRAQRDALGRRVPLMEAELVGSALHEFGHALGFQGHARRGGSVMVSSVEEVRRIGQRVLSGGGFSAPALRALYAVPSGVVVGRAQLRSGRTDFVDQMVARAAQLRLRGPFIRVGDRAARIAWREAATRSYAFFVHGLPEALRRPGSLVLEPGPRIGGLLEGRPAR